MPRPSLNIERRSEFIPVISRAFAELGYRRATSAELASRCGVRENILYRLWPDKKAMFIAAIDHVFEVGVRAWQRVLDEGERDGAGSSAERLLSHESRHHGELGLARIVFAGLNEADDPEIRRALAAMYRNYQSFMATRIREHRGSRSRRSDGVDDDDLTAWAFIGLGTIGSIAKELRMLGDRDRRRLVGEVGERLLD